MTPGELAIVVAVSSNGVIGRAGALPWHIPEDLERFKAITMGHAIIMGRKTHDSIGRALPGRRNIVVSRDLARSFAGCERAPTFDAAVALAHTSDPLPMVIGGAELYAQALPLATKLYLTQLDRHAEGDTLFPAFDKSQWREARREAGPEGVSFVELTRLQPGLGAGKGATRRPMKIYTKTGDGGDTSLFGGGRVGKDDLRVQAYGQVDELNAVIGHARSEGLGTMDGLAESIQHQLFTLGAVLATPQGSKAEKTLAPVRPEWTTAMEQAIDAFDTELPALTSFILPAGTKAAGALHFARTVCRRAERYVVPLVRNGKVNPEVVVFLNRLSDLLFTMARVANHRAGVKDTAWASQRD